MLPPPTASAAFWSRLDDLVASSQVHIERARGTPHPRYPAFVYPLDYGHLVDTASSDGAEVDVWVGSLPSREVTGVLGTVDLEKRDVELKLLLGCTAPEAVEILAIHNRGTQAGILMVRPEEGG